VCFISKGLLEQDALNLEEETILEIGLEKLFNIRSKGNVSVASREKRSCAFWGRDVAVHFIGESRLKISRIVRSLPTGVRLAYVVTIDGNKISVLSDMLDTQDLACYAKREEDCTFDEFLDHQRGLALFAKEAIRICLESSNNT
jgi:hypothetical protein